MDLKGKSLHIVLPVGILVLYAAGMVLALAPGKVLSRVVFSELGIVELGTAVFFILAAIIAFVLCYKAKTSSAGKWRLAYLIFGLGALFVALEEVNYGQYFIGFGTPTQIFELNTKGEFNLHNMFGNIIARRLNLVATIAFPTFLIVLPVFAALGKEAYSTNNWPYYILPGRRLILYAAIGQFMTWFDDLFGLFGIANAWTRATEMKEFYWAMASLLWITIIYRRILQPKRADIPYYRQEKSP